MAKSVTARKRMKDEDERCLQDNLPEIEDTVEANEIVTYLFSARVITFDDKIEITSTKPRKKRIRLLIDKLILHGGGAGLVEFIKALEKGCYYEIAKKLRSCGSSSDPNKNNWQGELTIKNWKRTSDIDCRVNQLEQKLSRIEILSIEQKDMKEHILTIKNTLKEITDLSKMALEKKTTMESLTQQLEEKTKKLEEAEELIASLQNKIKHLEEESEKDKIAIKVLNDSIVQQNFKIKELKNEVNLQAEATEELKKKDIEKEKRLERLEKLVDGQQRKKTVQRIVPRNRFQ